VSPIRCHRQSSRRRGDEERWLETLAARPATDVHARRARLADIRRLFETGPIDDDAVDSIRRGVGGLPERWVCPLAVRSSAGLEDVEAAWSHRQGRGLRDAHTRSVSSPGDRRLAAAGLVQLYLRSETLENPRQHAARRERMQKAAMDLLGPAASARPARREPARHDHDCRPPAPHRPGDRAASGARPAAGRASRWSRAADHQDRAIGRGYASLVGRDDRPVRHRAKPDPPVPGRGGHDRRDRRGRISAPATMSDTWWRSRYTRPSAMASASA
jgi:hypothetical protein